MNIEQILEAVKVECYAVQKGKHPSRATGEIHKLVLEALSIGLNTKFNDADEAQEGEK